jgi:squalene-hopene/tetraprenyl-beta-curcumene cyclase
LTPQAFASVRQANRSETRPTRLRSSIEAAQRFLLSIQSEDGHWRGELEGDTVLESEYVLAMHFLGRLGEAKVAKAGNYLRLRQLPSGGWANYPGGPADVSSSTKAYFVLKLLGDDPAAPHMQLARRQILDMGGIQACNSFTKIYLAIFEQYPWSRCPSVPPELILFPRWFYVNIYEMSSWSRAILVPLSIISARRPRCPVPASAAIPELNSAQTRPPQRSAWASFFFTMDIVVKQLERLPFRHLRSLALDRAERWTLERLQESDGLGAIFPPIVNTIIALRSQGYALDHPTILRQVGELEKLEIEEPDTLRVQPCFSPVWDTAYAINALVESGFPADHPAILNASRWLLDRRGHGKGDWRAKAGRRRAAGWYFEYANPYYPDCDTTSQVLTSLSKVTLPPGEDYARCQKAIFDSHEWHLAMQNEDGGWAAFDRGCDKVILTRVPFADHNAMIDPSTADLTARGLESLSELGFGKDFPAAARAVEFLRRTQEPEGAWYGRWGCNYLYGTYLALLGLQKIGINADDAAIRRGAGWLRSCQNPDGGWGETLGSYDDPSLKGKGASTPSQSAWAVLGLISAGERDSEAVRRGIQFLLDRQSEDGSWPEEEWTGTGFPRVFYLRYHLYPIYFPLLALGVAARPDALATRGHSLPRGKALGRRASTEGPLP